MYWQRLNNQSDQKKNRQMKVIKFLTITGIIASGVLVSCKADSNSPGLEYMPDMYRSPAVEAYVDYGEVGGKYNEEAHKIIEDKFSYLPPAGTVPYTEKGIYIAPYSHGAPAGSDKSHGLFGVAQDPLGFINARKDVNPIAYTEDVAAHGKALYNAQCVHCHGDKGAGDGTVITNGGGKFPPPPAYKKEMTPGEIYYIITYGRGAMGAHASQIKPQDRWELTHYVEKLAGKEKEFEQALLFDPNMDTDGDTVIDSEDECPTVAGTVANKGSQEVAPEIKAITDQADINVVFETGSSSIQTGAYPSLDRLLAFMLENNNFNLIINGHTDNTGDSNLNRALSLSRARMAKAYLVEKGVDNGRVSAVGYGQNKPVANNDSEEGRLANRRVEFRLYK